MLEEFLADLSRRGIQLWLEGEALRFRAPERKLDAAVRSELLRRKAEIVAQLRQVAAPASRPPLLGSVRPDPARRHEPFPLTEIQQAYWVGRSDLVLGGNVSAHTYQEIDLDDLDAPRFTAAWRCLIERHEMLRAVVLPDGTQHILPEVPPFEPRMEDLRSLGDAAREERLLALRERLAGEGPQIERWPLFELWLLRLTARRCRVLVAISLLLADALSFRTLLFELQLLYSQPSLPLAPLELSYRDYVLALDAAESGEAYQRSLAYWLSRLPYLPPAPELPLSPPTARARGGFARRRSELPAADWARIKERARGQGVTPTVVVAAAYATVLARWSGSRRFTLNLLFFNRQPLHPEIEAIVGNCSSTLPFEVDFAGAPSFAERARRLQARLLEDLEHARVSGVRVLREWNRTRPREARLILPVVLASTLNLGPRAAKLTTGAAEPELVGELVYGCLQTPHVWLDHQVSESLDGSLSCNWDAVEELFPAGLVGEMYAAYLRLLAWLATEESDWGAPLFAASGLELVPAEQLAERARANATAGPVSGLCLGDLPARGGGERSGAPAVVGGRRLSFAELSARADHLAAALQGAGAGPGTRVAIVLGKGWRQAVAALAITRAGAAYLPIDPALPTERRNFLFTHAEVVLALTEPAWRERLAWPSGVEPILVEDEPPAGVVPTLESRANAGDLAYLLYTSGSTGLPKGVAIDHRGPVNTILDLAARFALCTEDRFLALSALSFDLSVFDLFGAWAVGGAVVIPEPAEVTEPARWTELVRREQVTVWSSVPALAAMWVDFLEALPSAEVPGSIRLVLLSGDWIPLALPGRLKRLFPAAQVVSLGGATEASIWSIFFPIGELDPSWRSIPYGFPLLNQRFHVLDAELEPSPRLVPGDLFIAGLGLAQGYWNDPERTAASFFVHPRSGERLYRTGDLGRYLPGGAIEFLGRSDFQVKVQGYRIELGEIEAALAEHPGVAHAVVAALGPRLGEKRLVGYVVPVAAEVPRDELAAHLAAKLPAYMVPAAFVTLTALPLSANGKVDRGLLPAPEGSSSRAALAAVKPQSALEKTLAGLWEEVLERRPIGITDDFFELGGTSLLAVRLMAKIRIRCGRDLPLASLFTESTITLQAARLEAGAATDATPLVPIRAPAALLQGAPILALVHPVGGSALCYAELARELDPDLPIVGLELSDASWAEEGIEGLARRYLAALAAAGQNLLPILGGWSMGGLIAFEMARQRAARGEPVPDLFLIDSAAPGMEAGGGGELSDQGLLAWWAADLWQIAGLEPAWKLEQLEALPVAERLPAVARSAAAAGVLPAELDAAALGGHFARFAGAARALAAYRGDTLENEPYGGELLLLRGRESHLHGAATAVDGAWGWRGFAPRVTVCELPGDHYTLLQGENLKRLAAALTERLSRSRR